MSQESVVVLSSLHVLSARQCLRESLSQPQNIAPLPRVCAELAQLNASQIFDSSRLARLIESDLALAGEVMRVANSPAMRPRAAVVSLRQAVSWLGVAEVRNIAVAVMLHGEVFVAPGHEPASEELWREAWLAGLWAKEISRERRKHLESAFLAALMHRTGAALALKLLAQFEIEQRTVMDARSFADLVVEFEPGFGRLLMNSWNLPTDVQDAATDWRTYSTSAHCDLAATVNAAHLLATHTMYPQLAGADLVVEDPVFEKLDIASDDRRALLARCDRIRDLAGM